MAIDNPLYSIDIIHLFRLGQGEACDKWENLNGRYMIEFQLVNCWFNKDEVIFISLFNAVLFLTVMFVHELITY